jgi:hypothetical protein
MPGTMRCSFGFVSALTLTAVAACGSDPPPSFDPPPTEHTSEPPAPRATRASSPACGVSPPRAVRFARDVEPILMSACSGEFCHGMHMTSASRAYAFLLHETAFECDDPRPLVAPGDPDRSYVIDKVLGKNLCAGHPMPRGLENRLSAEEVRTLTDWICEGAPND